MADLLLSARAAGSDIEPLPHPGDDVFDLLDDEIVRGFFPLFPGHDTAREAAAEERTKSGLRFKDLYEREYGIPNGVATYETVARHMAAQDVVPRVLRDVLERCERLALEAGLNRRSDRHASPAQLPLRRPMAAIA